jgi:protein-tyrosine-phosphatase/peptidoglycan/xylan/chitin deacetylase (PgdA/CDA1 family)
VFVHHPGTGPLKELKRLMPGWLLEGLRELRDLPRGARGAWVLNVVTRRRRRFAAIARAGTLAGDPLIHFVCFGNIYRSPLAAEVLRHLVALRPDARVRVTSSGLLDREGRPSPEDARRIAPAFGVSLAAHASRTLSAADAAAADLLVVMDRRNEAMIRSRFPAQANKVLLLGSLDPLADVEGTVIPDPYGRGDDAVRAAYARITRCVFRLYELITFGRKHQPALGAVKRVARRVLMNPSLTPLWDRFTSDSAAILMLHRFEDRERGVLGHSADVLTANLEFLRTHDFHLSGLDDLVMRLACGEPPVPRTVVFTVDDGYADFARVGAPVFARFDCPATLFMTTGFVDGECWLWPDAVKWLIGNEPRGSLRFELADREEHIEWRTPAQRYQRFLALVERMKAAPSAAMEAGIQALAAASGTTLPPQPPPRYAPITWEEVHGWGARGMTFGAHARTHPILAQADPGRAHREITESFARVRAMTPHVSRVFAYPNGLPGDFGARERRSALAAGFVGAVASTGGHCARAHVRADRFAIPRIPYSDDIGDVRQSLVGVVRLKTMVRGLLR